MIDHDVRSGPLHHCQICGSENLELVLDVGHQPLCDTLLTSAMLSQPETYYPLRLNRCLECGLAQLDYIVENTVVFHPDYPYRSGITKELADYQSAMSRDLVNRYSIPVRSLVIDIGSNDGTLLSGFNKLGMRALGVEPTNIARIAQAAGVDTIQDFFSEKLARAIEHDRGRAKIMTATNVFAHIAALGEVMRGIKALLDTDGVFVTESHYLLNVVETGQYDTIYHEHIRTYCLKPLVGLFAQYDMDVFDVHCVSRYGGNIRVSACHKGKRPIAVSVARQLKIEEEAGLFGPKVYAGFRARAARSRDALMDLAHTARREGKQLVGNSCPGRCSTLLNYCGMTTDLMPYITEQPASLKLGLYLPGLHLPVVENTILAREQPDYVVLLAWHYAEPITKYLRDRGVRSTLVQPLPDVAILSN
jgi:C-methyltransferase C-terminal domain/Putative zinc binding domain/Methyltransferase domain